MGVGQTTATWLLALAGVVALVLVAWAAHRRGRRSGRAEADTVNGRQVEVLKGVIENGQMMTYVRSLEGRYLLANALFMEAVGKTEEELIGADTVTLFGAELGRRGMESDRAAMSGPHQFEVWMDRPDGPHCFESVKFPLADAGGAVYAIGGVSRDVTDVRLAHREAEKARDAALAASAAKSSFLATMSHEIRTPMNAVIGMTDLLMDTDLNPQQLDLLTTVRSSGDALMVVINDILDFSKIESGEMVLADEAFDLGAAARSCLELVAPAARSKGLDIVCWVDPGCPRMVVGDGPRLGQVLINLLSNAVKFTAVGDVLMTVRCAPEAGRLKVVFTVADTGIGIPSDSFAALFHSFSQVDESSTRAYGGTGLGLAIGRRLAQAMGGGVEVSSEPGVGSTFTLTVLLDPFVGDDAGVPPSPPQPMTGRAAPVTTAPALSGLTALLVDDSVTNLRILDLQLRSLGMSCTTADTAQAALSMAWSGNTFDFYIIDEQLPGMDGVELAGALRRIPGHSSARLILLSTPGAQSASPGQLIAASIPRPVRRAALRQTLTAVVTGYPRRAAVARALGEEPVETVPLRVLLAEDNPVNQRVAQIMLRRLGHRVDTVADGVAAVQAVRMNPYDVVLMDVQMPRMDGIEATRQIRELLPPERQPYITAITASTLIMDRDACLAAGMESYLTKPVRVHELEAMLSLARTAGAGASEGSS